MLALHKDQLRGRDVILFVDNEGALASLVRGGSGQADAAFVALLTHALALQLGIRVWYDSLEHFEVVGKDFGAVSSHFSRRRTAASRSRSVSSRRWRATSLSSWTSHRAVPTTFAGPRWLMQRW